MMNYGMIGSADGPTAVFVAGDLSFGWMNIWGVVILILILIPNIIYAVKLKGKGYKSTNKFMNILEQTGRYASMIFMVLGVQEFGFGSVAGLLIYLFGNAALLLVYWIVWILFFKKPSTGKQMALAVIPVLIFLLCGLTLRNILLIISAIIFAVGHIYTVRQNLNS